MTARLTISIPLEGLKMLCFLLMLQIALLYGYKAWQAAREPEGFGQELNALPFAVFCFAATCITLTMLGKWYVYLIR
jgi:Ca2+/Na+ antiporter